MTATQRKMNAASMTGLPFCAFAPCGFGRARRRQSRGHAGSGSAPVAASARPLPVLGRHVFDVQAAARLDTTLVLASAPRVFPLSIPDQVAHLAASYFGFHVLPHAGAPGVVGSDPGAWPNPNRMRSDVFTIILVRRCPKCGQEKPATREFWGLDRYRPSLCSNRCLRCTRRPRPNLCDRFWSKVHKRGPRECWLWTASVNGHGYGHFYVADKTRNGRCICVSAHRVAWALTHGYMPDADILHKCDNPALLQPEPSAARNARRQHARSTKQGAPRWRRPQCAPGAPSERARSRRDDRPADLQSTVVAVRAGTSNPEARALGVRLVRSARRDPAADRRVEYAGPDPREPRPRAADPVARDPEKLPMIDGPRQKP